MGSTEGGDSSWRPSKVSPAGNPEQYAHLTGSTEGGGPKPVKPPVITPKGGTEGGGNGGAGGNASATSDASAAASAGASASIGNMAISGGSLKNIFIPMPNAQASGYDSGGVDGGRNEGYNVLGIFAHTKGDSRVTPQTQTRRDTELICNVGINSGTLAGQGFAATTEMGNQVGRNPVARSTAQATFGVAAEAGVTSVSALEECRRRLAPNAGEINMPQLTFENIAPPAPPPREAPPPPAPVHHDRPQLKPKPPADCRGAQPEKH